MLFRSTPRPTPAPDSVQQHEVWIETAANGAERMELAARYRAAGIGTWCLGLEDPQVWAAVERWRKREPAS